MALSKRTVIEEIRVAVDGQVHVFERTEIWEGGFVNGTLEGKGSRTGRTLDVGDTIAGSESQLVKDVVNGNLHSAGRKAARDAKKAERAQ